MFHDDTKSAFPELKPFRFWCNKILPTVYDDSMSYYELLCKVVDKLNEITNVSNEMGAAITELTEYLENELDDTVREQLDKMFEDGSLGTLITSELYKNMVFATMADVISNADSLQKDSMVTTSEFYENSIYGGCSYKLIEGTEEDFGIYIGNGLVAVPVGDYVSPDELGYIYAENNDFSSYANKIINAGRNVRLRGNSYNAYTPIVIPHDKSVVFDGNDKTIYFYPASEKFLFEVYTGRKATSWEDNSEVFSCATIKNISAFSNDVGNFFKGVNKIPGYAPPREEYWGGEFILDNFNVNRFNNVFLLKGCYHCAITNGIVANCKTSNITNIDGYTDLFSNNIGFSNVTFTNTYVNDSFNPNWAIYLTQFPIITISNGHNIVFNKCVFERRRSVEINDGNVIHTNSGHAIIVQSLSNYISFNDCWFELLDYCYSTNRLPIDFNNCFYVNVLGYGEYGDVVVEPKCLIGRIKNTPVGNGLSDMILGDGSPIFRYRYVYYDGNTSHEPTTNLISVASNGVSTVLPVNEIHGKLTRANGDTTSEFVVDLPDLLGVFNDLAVGRKATFTVAVYDGEVYASQVYMWDFDVVKCGTQYRVSSLRPYQGNSTQLNLRLNVTVTSGSQSTRGKVTMQFSRVTAGGEVIAASYSPASVCWSANYITTKLPNLRNSF